jgi:hypothetical protein
VLNWIHHAWFAFYHRLYIDFWPPDAARVAPNLLAAAVQGLVVGAVAYLIWPRLRHRVNHWIELHWHAKVDEVKTEVKDHLAVQDAALADLHNCVDVVLKRAEHIIIHSPQIPNPPDLEVPEPPPAASPSVS